MNRDRFVDNLVERFLEEDEGLYDKDTEEEFDECMTSAAVAPFTPEKVVKVKNGK